MIILIPSILFTVIGVILVAQPGFLMRFLGDNDYEPLDTSGVIAAFCIAFCWGTAAVLVRKAVNAHFIQLELAASVQSSLIWLPLFSGSNELLIHNDLFGNYDEWQFDIWSFSFHYQFGHHLLHRQPRCNHKMWQHPNYSNFSMDQFLLALCNGQIQNLQHCREYKMIHLDHKMQ